jgi:RHS repeat-associated protein
LLKDIQKLMKKYIPILILLLSAISSLQAQTFSDDNFIYTAAPKKAVQSANYNTLTKDDITQSVTYFDGLGRPIQSIAIGQGDNGLDIITPMEYDGFGRQVIDYLPYTVSNGGTSYPKVDPLAAITALKGVYSNKYPGTLNPFSEKKLEASPLNRVLKQAALGTPWKMDSGQEIKLDYQTNISTDAVKLYTVNTTWNAGLGLYDISAPIAGSYAEKELYKNVTYDENTAPGSNVGTEEFKNKEGQVVLKRTYDATVKHDTYYVYDIYGNLTYVIPPKADGVINDDVLNGLCYQYKYDYRNRLVEKKLPGKQWEFIVYDKLDRPVATGPAFSPFKDDTAVGWLITKYDAMGRTIYTGWTSQAVSQAVSQAGRYSLQGTQNGATVLFETKTALPIDGIATNYNNANTPTFFKLLTVNYYDDYSFPGAQAISSPILGQVVLTNTKGLPTGSWTRALSTALSIAGETTTIFYDEKGRAISTYIKNHLTGVSHTDNELDFSGKTLSSISEHQRLSTDSKIIIKEKFSYTAQDRLFTHTHQIGSGAEQLMAENKYDELGQLTSKKIGNSAGTPLQKVDFNYNIRGWLTEINKTSGLQQNPDPLDLFAFKINYNNTPLSPAVKALYNGNISETFWKTASDNAERGYGYKYDNLNRLSAAIYEKNGLVTEMYNENLSYDKNGNIMFLNRNGDMDPQIGTTSIDALTYNYLNNSNLLTKVTDGLAGNDSKGFLDGNKTGDDFGYDANGNMITDKNKNITAITYNQLNLPKKITFGTTGSIEYIYNAAGQKLEKIVTEGTVTTNTNYLAGFQYKNNVLEFFPTAEGYVKNTSGVLSYVFQYKDHLGNVRLSYAKNPTTQVLEIIEENNYYPFGLKHKGYNDYIPNTNKYKFQGQERQDELSLNWDSFKWRNYDYSIGRFMSIDPLAEKYYHNSPYAFSENRVIDAFELEGLEAVQVKDSQSRCVDVTVSVKPVNNTVNYPVTNEQIGTAMNNFQSQAQRTYSGVTPDGTQVNVNIVIDPQATLTVNFVDVVTNPSNDGSNTTSDVANSLAPGFTDATSVGNTQTGTVQISTANTTLTGNPTDAKPGAGGTTSHEVGHIFGLPDNKKDIKENRMNSPGNNATDKKITPEQRQKMLDNIPVQK